ncbi:type II toxin-antitoxin system RelE/ParE family toxin [Flavobacterium ginsengiterrae]|uniref:Plasmid stabilization system protein ParE n=1 Tax=Flavobacterium ginsengiterrae TaxID=871695 RepID=A0ABP7GHW1_9FLAO
MRIVWTKKANHTFYNIKNYLEQYWTLLISKKFINDVLHIIVLLEKNPQLGKYNVELSCREIVVSKQVKLYYEIKENNLILIAFSNNRQKPMSFINLQS